MRPKTKPPTTSRPAPKDDFIEPVSEEIVPLDDDFSGNFDGDFAADDGDDYGYVPDAVPEGDESESMPAPPMSFNFDEELMDDPMATICDVVDFQSDQFNVGDAGSFLDHAEAIQDAVASAPRGKSSSPVVDQHSQELEALDPAEALKMFEQWNTKKPETDAKPAAPAKPATRPIAPAAKPKLPPQPEAEPASAFDDDFLAAEMAELLDEGDFATPDRDAADFSHFGNADTDAGIADEDVAELFDEISGPLSSGDIDELAAPVGRVQLPPPPSDAGKRSRDTEFNLPDFSNLPTPSDVYSPVDPDAIATEPEPERESPKIKLPPMPRLGGGTSLPASTPSVAADAKGWDAPEALPEMMPEDADAAMAMHDGIFGAADDMFAESEADRGEFSFDDPAINADAMPLSGVSDSQAEIFAVGESSDVDADAEIDNLLAELDHGEPTAGDLAMMDTAELDAVSPEMAAVRDAAAVAAPPAPPVDLPPLPVSTWDDEDSATATQLDPLPTTAHAIAAAAALAADANLSPAEREAKLRLGDVLEAEGTVTEEDVDALLGESSALADALRGMGLVSQDELRLLLARRYHPATISLTDLTPAPEAVALVPRSLAEQLTAVPLRRTGPVLIVAAATPGDVNVVRELRHACRLKVKLVGASPADVQRAIAVAYPTPSHAAPTPSGKPTAAAVPSAPPPRPTPIVAAKPIHAEPPPLAAAAQPFGKPAVPVKPTPIKPKTAIRPGTAARPKPAAAASAAVPPVVDDELAAALAELEMVAREAPDLPPGDDASPGRIVVSEVISAFKLPPPATTSTPPSAPPPRVTPQSRRPSGIRPASTAPPARPASAAPPSARPVTPNTVSDVNIQAFKMPLPSGPSAGGDTTPEPKKVKAKKGTTRRHVPPPTGASAVPSASSALPPPGGAPMVSDVTIPTLRLPVPPPVSSAPPPSPRGVPVHPGSSDRLRAISNPSETDREQVMASIQKPKPTVRPVTRGIGKPPASARPQSPDHNPLYQPEPHLDSGAGDGGETLVYLNEDQLRQYAEANAAPVPISADADDDPMAEPFTFDDDSTEFIDGNFDEF